MASHSAATTIPLPFATAGIGLFLSYLFSQHVNAPAATATGFFAGVLALYLAGRADSSLDPQHPQAGPQAGQAPGLEPIASSRWLNPAPQTRKFRRQ